jgi:hypothetical protein
MPSTPKVWGHLAALTVYVDGEAVSHEVRLGSA